MFKNLFKKNVITEEIAIKYAYREIESVYYYTSITLEGAKILGASNLRVLGLHFIKKIDADIARELAKFRGDRLDLRSLESIDQETANELGRYFGKLDIGNETIKKKVENAHNEYLLKLLDNAKDFSSPYGYEDPYR